MVVTGWVAALGVLLLLTAGPLARAGEHSQSVLSGDYGQDPPHTAHPLIVWAVRAHGLVLIAAAVGVAFLT